MAAGTATEQLDRIEEQLKALNLTLGDFFTETMNMFYVVAERITTADQNNVLGLSAVVDAITAQVPYLTKIQNGVWDSAGNIAYADRAAQRLLTISNKLNTWDGKLDAQTAFLLDIYNTDQQILSALQFLNSTIGAGDGPGNDIISILRQSNELLADPGCGCIGINTDPESCPERLTSNGMELIPFGLVFGENVHVAEFPPTLPAGVEFGTFFGLQTLNSELHNTTEQGWAGWSIFVASRSETFAIDPVSLKRYPTNKWLTMFGFPANIALAVSGDYGIVAHLCPDPVVAPPQPEGASGWFGGRNTRVENTRTDKLFFLAGSSMSNLSTLQTLTPPPHPDNIGRTLYFTHCAYTGNGPDKKIYVSKDADNPKVNAFLVLEPGDKNVPWIVTEDVTSVLMTASWEGTTPGDQSYVAGMMSWIPYDNPCAEIWDDIP